MPKTEPHDPRLHLAIKGMVIVPDEGILILDKTLSELSGVNVRVLPQTADRKKISSHTLRSQVIDFNCDLENMVPGATKGGHYRKGYTRAAATSLPALLGGNAGAKLGGLEQLLAMAFDIAETQLDTNPAAIEIRRLEALGRTVDTAIVNAETSATPN